MNRRDTPDEQKLSRVRRGRSGRARPYAFVVPEFPWTRRAESDPISAPAARPATDHFASLVLEVLDQGVVVVDRDERAVLANPAARAMGLIVADRLAVTELNELVRKAIANETPVQGATELPLGGLGREPVAVSLSASPLFEGDVVIAVALTVSDVTEQRRLEAVRRDFVANVSHELKTPVGALTLLAEAINDAADDPEAVQHFATRMQHEGTRLGRLVRELIDLSRLQGAEPLPGDALVEVAPMVSEAADRTRLAADNADIEVRVSAPDGLFVRGNESQLTMAVANLIDNAVAYSQSGTKVAVSVRPVGDFVEIAVSDQGVGIAEADQGRVFERFYRVDQARSRATGGTGLGLAIVKHVCTNHGGSVGLWSAEGAGSTFTIRLPLVHSPKQSSSTSA
jgi:two-component system, OmpR family, sensor histidine kinase SenX3